MPWLVEVKMNKDMGSPDTDGKREVARCWANRRSREGIVGKH
jgi:hypothetical protein